MSLPVQITVKVGKYYRRGIRDIIEFIEKNGGRVPLIVLMEYFGHDTLAAFFRVAACRIEFRIEDGNRNGKQEGIEDD